MPGVYVPSPDFTPNKTKNYLNRTQFPRYLGVRFKLMWSLGFLSLNPKEPFALMLNMSKHRKEDPHKF